MLNEFVASQNQFPACTYTPPETVATLPETATE